MTKALLVIDIQNDYFPGGKMELVGSPEAAKRAAELVQAFRKAGELVIFIQHTAVKPGASFFLKGTSGAEIHKAVAPRENEIVVEKHFPNSFRETGLLEILQSKAIGQLVICGMQTHMCVDATTRAAADFGFDCLVASDACASRDLAFEDQKIPAAAVHAAFLAALNGTYAGVMPTAQILKG